MTDMFVHLNSLTESLDKKLQESAPLTERFNDSFPKWLRDRIVVTKKAGDYRTARDIPYEDRPSYINARDEKYDNAAQRSLFQKALNAGIDFEKTKVIEGPIPAKRTDERLKEPNIPVWFFSNGDPNSSGQVYIEGLNDSEIFNGNGRAFKYLPMKEKLAYAKGFAYIDGRTLDPDAYKNLRMSRAETKSELRDIPNYTRKGTADFDNFSRYSYGSTYDKSGYLVDPSKYERELRKSLGNKIYAELEAMHDTIAESQRKAIEAYSQVDPFDDDGEGRSIRELLDDIESAVRNYNNYMNRVQKILGSSYYSEEEKQRELGRIVSNIRDNNSIKRVKEYGSNIFLKDIDWD